MLKNKSLIISVCIFIFLVAFYFITKQTSYSLHKINRFHYQLQKIDLNSEIFRGLKNSIVVIDYSKDGTDAQAFKQDEILKLKAQGNLVLSYLSIGEAESYRWYFSSLSPDLKATQNQIFKDNFKVKFWDRSWKEFIFNSENSYLSKIQNAGFDGVYLDLVDAYTAFPLMPSAANEMIQFILEMSVKARSKNSNFIFIQQNASCITKEVKDSKLLENYWKTIDGIALESTFYFGSKFDDNDLNPQVEVLNCVKTFQQHDKAVLAIEYLRASEKQKHAVELFKQNKMLGVVTDRLLKGEFFISN